jgi:hypothetical protein
MLRPTTLSVAAADVIVSAGLGKSGNSWCVNTLHQYLTALNVRKQLWHLVLQLSRVLIKHATITQPLSLRGVQTSALTAALTACTALKSVSKLAFILSQCDMTWQTSCSGAKSCRRNLNLASKARLTCSE